MVDDQEIRLQEALEALTAFQLDEEENEYTTGNELLLSLQNIEPLPLVEDSDIHVYENEDYGNSDPLNPEIIALLSIDDAGGSIRTSANNLAVTKEEPSSITIEKETADYTDFSTPNTTSTGTDSLPDIEINFGDDSFLVDSNQLYSVFDEDFNDGSRNKDINVVIEKEKGDKREDTGSVDELTQYYPSISGQEQHRSSYKEEDFFEDSIAADFIVDIDLETEELYKELANMSLHGHTNDSSTHSVINKSGNNNNNDISNDDAANAIVAEDLLTQMDATGTDCTDGTDGLPFYLVCQPCCEDDTNDDNHDNTNDEGNSNYSSIYGVDQFRSLDHSLPPITEDQPLNDDEAESEAVRYEREQHIRDLRELYEASSKRDEQQDFIPLDHSDPLLIELEAQRAATEDIQLEDYPQEDETVREAAKYWTEAFGIKLDERTPVKSTTAPISSKDTSKVCYGHKETIYGVSFSEDGKHVATASQDATIGIWDVGTNRLLKSLKGHNTKYECLRVDWAGRKWADQILDRSIRFANILASSAADGTVKLWSCEEMKDRDQCMKTWKCEYSLDHAGILSQGTTSDEKGGDNSGESVKEESSTKVENSNDNDDKPQVYSLQFIDHWKVFTKDIRQQQQQQCPHHPQQEQHESRVLNDDDYDKNSFLMTSSDEFIHLWEVPSHPYDQQLKLDDQKIRILQEEIKLKEVMSFHFGPLDQYGFGVTACSITGMGLQLPPPPKAKQNLDGNQISFGGKRNPSNIIFVFDASYSPASGLLGVALADGSLRLVNGRGICISVINLPGNRSHLTSFSWSSCGTRLTTCAATGHMLAWSLDPESHDGGNRHTVATCTAIFEGGHQPGRPLFGSRYCGGPDENLLLSWGVDGKMCLWYSNARGNIYDPVAILKNNSDYPIYAVEISKSEQDVAVCGGDEGGFVGIPFHLYNLPPSDKIHINKEKDSDSGNGI